MCTLEKQALLGVFVCKCANRSDPNRNLVFRVRLWALRSAIRHLLTDLYLLSSHRGVLRNINECLGAVIQVGLCH